MVCYNNAGGSNISHGIDSDVPNQEPCSYSYKYEVTGSAPTSDSNYLMLRQYLEVYDVRHLGFGTSGAKSLTLSFWLKSNHSGTVTWNLMSQNATQQRQISRQVQIDGSGSWKKYVMTVPGDIGGTGISNTGGNNGQGLYFDLIFWTESGWGSGTRFNDTWQNNVTGERAVGHINMLTKLNDYINITGVQLEVGKNATEFEHRSYGEELALCQRYYEKSFPDNVTPAKGSTTTSLASGGQPTTTLDWNASFTAGTLATYHRFKVDKRGIATMTFYGTSNDKCIFFDFGTKALIYPGFVIDSITRAGFRSYNNTAGLTNNSSWGVDAFNWVADAEL